MGERMLTSALDTENQYMVSAIFKVHLLCSDILRWQGVGFNSGYQSQRSEKQ